MKNQVELLEDDQDSSENEDLKKPKQEEKVIMDLNHKKMLKKDHIFMDFFAMYGKNFIETKKNNGNQKKANTTITSNGFQTPISHDNQKSNRY